MDQKNQNQDQGQSGQSQTQTGGQQNYSNQNVNKEPAERSRKQTRGGTSNHENDSEYVDTVEDEDLNSVEGSE